MTPEERLDRAEYILVRMAKSGREARTEFRQKINILIKTQLETEEIMKGLALGQARFNQEMAELEKSQRLAEQALHQEMAELEKSQRLAEQALHQEMAELEKSQLLTEQALHQEMAKLANSQRLTDEALRAYINSQRKGQNDDSSN